jgi:YVTN family beta-propeller protein
VLKALALVLLVASEPAFAQNAYITNSGDNTVSEIDTATNTVVAVLPVGGNAFGVFIQPRFAGAPGDANCYGQSISSLAKTFGGLNAAVIALGFPIVGALQTAVNAFCGL